VDRRDTGIAHWEADMSRGTMVLMAGLVLAASACAHRGGTQAPLMPAVRVHVVNHYELSMEVYASVGTVNHRLGLVSPGIARDFFLPQALIGQGPIEFYAQPSGSTQTVRGGQVNVSPGDILDFEITTQLIDSRVTVRM